MTTSPAPTMNKQLLVIANGIGHFVAGAGTVYLLVTHKIDPVAGAAILASLGGFWSGVGATLKSAGSSTAATVSSVESVSTSAAPAPVSLPADTLHTPDAAAPAPGV